MVTGTKGSPLELKKQLESVYPINASIIGASSAKSIKALNRRIRWGEIGILYQHDPRHVDVLVESLALENGDAVQTPMVDDVKDENPVWLDSEQISKYRSHVARCVFRSQDRADITFALNELCRRMSDPSQHSFTKLMRLARYLKGQRQRIQVFEFGNTSSEVTGWRQRNEDIVKRGSRARRTTPFESVHKKTEDHRQVQCRGRTVRSSFGSIRMRKVQKQQNTLSIDMELAI